MPQKIALSHSSNP